MAAVNIVIKAINSTKAAFQEVGRQADTLNKRMAKIGQVFKGLFIGGVAIRFGKSLLQASTYGKELEESGTRVKEAWSGVTTEIGDAFARIVLALEGPIKRVGGFLDTVIKRAQWGAAYITGLVTTGSSEKARKIADEVIADLEAEKKAREDATDAATNDHAKTVNYENSSKPGSMAARSKERMDKLNKLDPSWRSADYLKRINTALDSLTNTLEGA
jgi:hypothetical protein